jgi:hypothetical protein
VRSARLVVEPEHFLLGGVKFCRAGLAVGGPGVGGVCQLGSGGDDEYGCHQSGKAGEGPWFTHGLPGRPKVGRDQSLSLRSQVFRQTGLGERWRNPDLPTVYQQLADS